LKQRNILIFLALLCSPAFAAESAGPAANQASLKIIGGAKIAMQRQPDKFNPRCVTKIPGDLLSPYIQILLESGLSSTELNEMNNFYATKLAVAFDSDLLAQKANTPGYKSVQFSQSEKVTIGTTLTSPTAKKYFSIVSEDNPDLMKSASNALGPFLELCSQRPN